MGNGGRMHVGQTTARQPGLQGVQTVARGIKRIQPASAAHGGTNGQGLAAGTGAKVHHHLATLGVKQHGQQLRALVLHLERATGESLGFVQSRFAGNAQTQR